MEEASQDVAFDFDYRNPPKRLTRGGLYLSHSMTTAKPTVSRRAVHEFRAPTKQQTPQKFQWTIGLLRESIRGLAGVSEIR